MSWIVQAASYLPSVKEPEKEQSLKQMLTWTGIVLVLYFILGSINLYGANAASVQQALQTLATYQTILGAQIGSIITLGIGPIVTASIILQMMVGSELLPWNTNNQEGQQKFQAAQKLLAYGLTIVQAFGYVLSGTFGNVAGDPFLILLLAGQISLGGWLIIMMDDLVQKWGFGSGTGLFIAAGVSKQVYISILSPLVTPENTLFWTTGGNPVGNLFVFAQTQQITSLIPILSTIAVFSAVVYLQSMRVEIPLTFGNVRGFGQKWPLKFLYTSNMPVILIAALISNVQIVGTTLAGPDGCSPLGCFNAQGQAQSGLVNMLQAPVQIFQSLITSGLQGVTLGDVFHIFFYIGVYAFGSILFSIFWMKTSGQDADSVASQIQNTGMKVPGFRKDKRVIKKVLNRYIPGLTVLSGFSVGLLAALANMTQAAGGGTGILLTVMILYQLYEQLAQKHMEELHPAMKDFLS
ncbi:preprotein translocase subunit SecY [Candidatus Nanohalovita haloferacivicina]|uniref:preprotein translocase subunit SecY n=1 Tax=Candidatus Nanohalovita haloferacivicina TaxID=2978046 RepID=UPI00325FA98B|nr:Preprotein translocase subunit SecY [Candidatus Nanohalobia archaeon BNXNv]